MTYTNSEKYASRDTAMPCPVRAYATFHNWYYYQILRLKLPLHLLLARASEKLKNQEVLKPDLVSACITNYQLPITDDGFNILLNFPELLPLVFDPIFFRRALLGCFLLIPRLLL
ncbi:hypothetical protein E5S67_02983 [Microcoleus sp. IPMA8]|uniref:Uncharacterized protein n=1 Tax=Microcoleus asticus IPMA8 TaxID=2563858 RepID=A0ABX2CZD4_9CYAN|nr:hypothetical protein [Microcoleus asticus IPMA8]